MGVYTIQLPDGRKLDIEAANEAGAIKGAQTWFKSNPKPKSAAQADAERHIERSNPKEGEAARQFFRQATLNGTEAFDAAAFATGEKLRGRAGWREAYDAARDAQERQIAARNNGVNTAAGVLGGVVSALYGGAEIKGLTLLPRVIQGAKAGVKIGALAGLFNARKAEDVPKDVVMGGVAGGALGGAAPLAGAGLTTGYRVIAKPAAQRVAGAVRAVAGDTKNLVTGKPAEVSPKAAAEAEAKAKRYLLERIKQANTTPKEIANRANPNAPQTVAGAIGPSAIQEVKSLGARPGKTSTTAYDLYSSRAAERNQRILSHIHETTGIDPETARSGVEGVVKAGRQAADPLFTAMRENTAPVWNEELARLVQEDPHVRRALATVVNNTRKPTAPGIRLDPDTGLLSDSRSLSDAVEHQPTASTWEDVRQQLGQDIVRDAFGRPVPNALSPFNRQVTTAAEDLTGLLRKHVPGMEEALTVAGDYKSIEGAFNRTTGKLLSRQFRPDQFATLWGTLKTPAEQRAARHALAADLFDRAENDKLPLSQLTTPSVRKKLTTAFGPDKAEDIIKQLAAEHAMKAEEQAARPMMNSPTGPIQLTARAHDEAAGVDLIGDLHRHGIAGALSAAVVAPLKSAASGALSPHGMAFRDALGELYLSHPADLPELVGKLPEPKRLPPVAPYLIGPAVAPTAGALSRSQ